MRIGASFNFPQLPQRPAAQTAIPAQSGKDKDAAHARTSVPTATQIDPSIDFSKARMTQQADSTGFYSTDRELSLRGQEAMQTYLTTAGFQFGNARSELVGVDIYA